MIPFWLGAYILFVIFCLFRTRERSVLPLLVLGTFYLPSIPQLVWWFPFYGKLVFTGPVLLVLSILFNFKRFQPIKLRWADVMMLLYCVCQFIPFLLPGNAVRAGAPTEAAQKLTTWLAPYIIGRIYLQNDELKTSFLKALALAGACYAPLCIYELVQQESLQMLFSGVPVRVVAPVVLPSAFFSHPLFAGFAMAMSVVAACGLLVEKRQRDSIYVFYAIMSALGVLCTHSVGPAILMVFGLTLMASKTVRTKLAALAGGAALAYLVLGAAGRLDEVALSRAIASTLGQRAAHSVEYRNAQEYFISTRVSERPFFGWGAADGGMVRENGKTLSVRDSTWIVVFGQDGWIGLLLLFGTMFLACFPSLLQASGARPSSMVLYVIGLTGFLDALINGFPNPVWVAALGGSVNHRAIRIPLPEAAIFIIALTGISVLTFRSYSDPAIHRSHKNLRKLELLSVPLPFNRFPPGMEMKDVFKRSTDGYIWKGNYFCWRGAFDLSRYRAFDVKIENKQKNPFLFAAFVQDTNSLSVKSQRLKEVKIHKGKRLVSFLLTPMAGKKHLEKIGLICFGRKHIGRRPSQVVLQSIKMVAR